MHTDARGLEDGTLIEGDLCIVGAGAAGISLALEWAGTAHDVILLEGGGFEVESQMQDLHDGQITGLPYYPLDAARLHAFGGTTGHWSGYCAPLDPIDFRKRDWVPRSGWPFGREELDPFYARAQKLLELGPYNYKPSYWARQETDAVELPLDDGVARTKMWQRSPPTRFGKKYREEITGADNIHLLTYANVTEVRANESVNRVNSLRVKAPNGKQHQAQALQYVLACGAIQNARLLLASNRQASAGLGNDHDLVGRYFMEHIGLMPSAQLRLPERRPMNLYWYTGTKAAGMVGLTRETQRRHRLLNGAALIVPAAFDGELKGLFQRDPPEKLRQRWLGYDQAREGGGETDAGGEEAAELPAPSKQRTFGLLTQQEQIPNPRSRVTLSGETDALGVPRVALDWKLTEQDRRSIRQFYEVLGQEMGRSGIGRVKILDWLRGDKSSWPDFLSGMWHHMGTTRMHKDPTRGVVDPNCRVHGLGNLYVAGSAVFPTSGVANPTLTLIALTLRLSDHLEAKLN
jgi:choline dehydrogenase-like flavoprotein